jgi:tape measure domain-containing protein
MADILTWTFRAIDAISPSLRRSVSSIDALRASLGGASQGVSGLTRAAGTMTGAVSSAVSGLSRVASVAATIAGAGVAIGAAFGGVAATIGRSVLEMIRFRESAVVTLGTLMRGRGQGREAIARVGGAAYRQTQALARMTPGNERDVIAARQQLAAGGFRGADEERVLAGSLDVGALNAGDSTAQSRFVRALSQIRGRGKLQAEELNQLGELGIGRGDVFAAIARQRGLQGDEAAQRRQVEALMQRGQITGEEGTNAALSAVQNMTGERLGGFARLQGNTLAGSISNLEESIFGLITSIEGLEQLPGVRALASTISALGNALNGSSAAGQRLQRAIGPVLSMAAGALAGVLNPARIEGFFSALATQIPAIVSAIQLVGGGFLTGLQRGLGPLLDRMGGADIDGLVGGMGALAEAFGNIVGLSVVVLTAIGGIAAVATVGASSVLDLAVQIAGLPGRIIADLADIPRQLTAFGEILTAAFTSLGTQMVAGLVGGITSGAGAVRDAVSGLATGAVDTVRETLGIHSPSRVFEELGGHTAQGFEDGITGGSAGVDGAVRAMVAAPGAAGTTGAAGAGRGVFQVFIDGAGREASAIVDEMEARMGFSFDRLALSGGDV